MADRMASNTWIYSNFNVGPNDSRMPTKSVIQGYGLSVPDSYASNQLVKEKDIQESLVDIPFYVILNWHNVPYNSRMVYYQGQYRFVQYFNLITPKQGDYGTVSMRNGTSYPIYMNTSLDSAGDTRFLNFDSANNTLIYPISMQASSFNRFKVPPGIDIEGVYVNDIYISFYDAYYTPIGTSDSVTTTFCYRLSLCVNYRGWWEIAGHADSEHGWTNIYGQRITGSQVGYSDRYCLSTGTDLKGYNDIRFNSNNLTGSDRGFAIVFDFYEYGSSGGDSNSSW